jgi:hypothetical protein
MEKLLVMKNYFTLEIDYMEKLVVLKNYFDSKFD